MEAREARLPVLLDKQECLFYRLPAGCGDLITLWNGRLARSIQGNKEQGDGRKETPLGLDEHSSY